MKTTGRTLWTATAVAVAAACLYRPDMLERLSPAAGGWARNARAALPEGFAKTVGLAGPGPVLRIEAAPAAGAARPPVSVVLAEATIRPTEVRLDAIGAVQPAATVSVRPRVDSQVVDVPVKDGAAVKAGDVLIRLDSRQIDAQVKQAEAQLAKDKAGVEQADRDAARTADLVARGSGAQLAADNARTALQTARAVMAADQAALDNLRVQQSYYAITAPLTGRIGVIALKPGAVARQGEAANAIAVINQISPIYVAFTAPQNRLPDLREAMNSGAARAYATPQGSTTPVEGKVAFIDNAIDPNTGSITARALFENGDETLWPGQFCNVRVVLRVEPDALVVPREAVMTGQSGTYVFVADGEVARMRPVQVARVQDEVAVLTSGVRAGDKVVVDGQSMLTPDARIAVRAAGAQPAKSEPGKSDAAKPDLAKPAGASKSPG